MTPELRARIGRRNTASRLRSDLTGISLVAGLVATAGFGWLAAETYAGTPKDSTTKATTTDPTTATPAPTTNPGSTTSNGSTSSGSSSSGGSVSGSSGVSTSRGRGHVTTGSS